MKISRDETRALGFVALLLALSALARMAGREAAPLPGIEALDAAAHEREASRAAAEAARRRQPLGAGERIDPNTAPAGELDRLPGVGAALAERIVEERERGGPFRSAADLTRVPGIGDRTAERLAPLLALPELPARPAGGAGGGGGGGEGGEKAGGTAGGGVVEVNRADAADLQRLPGVGPALAGRIVAHRDSAGPFRAVEELLAVQGIGPALLARLRPHLRIDP